MLKRTQSGSASRLMAAVAIALACMQASAMALANVACCCRMTMAAAADCPMHDAAAMPAHHHHQMAGMTASPSAPAPDDATCRFACRAFVSTSLFVTPGVTPVAPMAIAVELAPAPAPDQPSLHPIDLARVPHAPPPRA